MGFWFGVLMGLLGVINPVWAQDFHEGDTIRLIEWGHGLCGSEFFSACYLPASRSPSMGQDLGPLSGGRRAVGALRKGGVVLESMVSGTRLTSVIEREITLHQRHHLTLMGFCKPIVPFSIFINQRHFQGIEPVPVSI
ncbi:hypothetical protein Nwat_2442 [Nitrosococcus watsonii C-113]|uniref:Uncharacterized protein n=1 Tax=Nitrosococcus watsoni (strain C-113) TaxID=105559 RepID=D8K9B1_NITWC|nr:hypothetical protein Nwat_2442 [Nitrosococcus watsonii C-113]